MPGAAATRSACCAIGDRVDVSLLRDGKPRRVTAVIGERDAAAESKAAGFHEGLQGAELVDAQGGGVLIRSVAEGSPAAERGLRSNDVILAVGRTRVATSPTSSARPRVRLRSSCRSGAAARCW